MITLKTLKAMFVNFEDGAWESHMKTKDMVRQYLNNKAYLQSYIDDLKDDIELCSDDDSKMILDHTEDMKREVNELENHLKTLE
jgi:hypothetical protein